MREIKIGQVYKHFKGNYYKVIGIAQHTERNEKLVIYEQLYSPFQVYARPYEMFASEVDKEKYPNVEQTYRFEEI